MDILRLLAPILPHTADEAWHSARRAGCVHLERHQSVGTAVRRDGRRSREKLLTLKALEEAKERGIENSLDAGVVLPDSDGSLPAFASDLADLFEVSRVRVDPDAAAVAVEIFPRPAGVRTLVAQDDTVTERANGCMLSDRDWDAGRRGDSGSESDQVDGSEIGIPRPRRMPGHCGLDHHVGVDQDHSCSTSSGMSTVPSVLRSTASPPPEPQSAMTLRSRSRR